MSTRKKNTNKNLVAILVILIMLTCVITGSTAIFLTIKNGQRINKLSTGTLILQLNEDKGINLVTAVPMSDTKGMETTPYTFSIKNTGTVNAQYKISIIDDEEGYKEDGCTQNKLPWSNIKYELIKNNESLNPKIISKSDGVIDSGILNMLSINYYSLRLWIDSDSTNEIMGKHFHGKIKIEGIMEGHTNYITGE